MIILVNSLLLFLVICLIHSGVAETSERIFQDFVNGSLVTENSTKASGPGGINPMIIKGQLPRGGQFPFVARLRWMFYYTRPKGAVDEIQCTAVIISQEFVMTAASCFQIIIYNKKKRDDTLLDIPLTRAYGRTFVQMDGESALGAVITRVRSGIRLIVHPAYLHPSTMFDVNIALVQVVPRWSLRESGILKVPTPARNLLPTDGNLYHCLGVGTGKVVEGPYEWEDQKKSWQELSTGGVGYCKYLHKEFNQKIVHVDSMYLCGKSKRPGQDFCGGDIGSALMCNGLLAGILSQRIVKKPCQLVGKQFTMFTAVGAKPVYDFIKKYVPDFRSLKDIPPPPDPWGLKRSVVEDVDWDEKESNATMVAF